MNTKIIREGIFIIIFLVAAVLVLVHMTPQSTYYLNGITPGEPTENVNY